MDMIRKIRNIFLLFVIYAVLGWIYEVVGTMIVYGYFENRGFLYGPWLPIYGLGGLGVYAAFGRLAAKPAKPLVIVIRTAALIAGITIMTAAFELAASYILDAVGIGYRTLWVYDGEPFSFDGRVGLISSLRFGIIGVAALYLTVLLRKHVGHTKHDAALNIAACTLAALFLADVFARFFSGSNMG